MKLSDAIRAGSKLRPQQLFYTMENNEMTGACAIGAAHAAGYNVRHLDMTNVDVKSCPGCGKAVFFPSIVSLIIHLNDYHRWERERIAEWLDTIGFEGGRPMVVTPKEVVVEEELVGV